MGALMNLGLTIALKDFYDSPMSQNIQQDSAYGQDRKDDKRYPGF